MLCILTNRAGTWVGVALRILLGKRLSAGRAAGAGGEGCSGEEFLHGFAHSGEV